MNDSQVPTPHLTLSSQFSSGGEHCGHLATLDTSELDTNPIDVQDPQTKSDNVGKQHFTTLETFDLSAGAFERRQKHPVAAPSRPPTPSCSARSHLRLPKLEILIPTNARIGPTVLQPREVDSSLCAADCRLTEFMVFGDDSAFPRVPHWVNEEKENIPWRDVTEVYNSVTMKRNNNFF